MNPFSRKHSGSEHEQVVERLNAIIWHLQIAYRKTGTCKCSGREEIGPILDVALEMRAILKNTNNRAVSLEMLPTIVWLGKFLIETISSISNDYQFPEDYEYRVDYKKVA